MEVNKQKIHWELVFFIREFKEYVDINDLIELSLTSKLIRLKLSSTLFSCIEFNNQNLSMRSNYFANEEDKWQMKNRSIMKKFKSYSKRVFDRNSEFKSSIIDPFVNDIQLELGAYQEHVKEIKFLSLEKPCYYIFPISQIFTSLTKLTLFDVYINLNGFINAMKALENLKKLNLNLVAFEKLSRSVSYNEDIFSQSLSELNIDNCTISSSMLPNKPLKYLFDMNLEHSQFAIQFKPSFLPNLKALSLKSNDFPSYYINLWLAMNPHLLDIRFNIVNPREIELDLIAQNNTLQSLEIEFLLHEYYITSLDTPLLISIQYLNIRKIRARCPIVKELIFSCPNITKLELELMYYNEEYITDLESRLHNLKSLSLNLCELTETKFKIPKLVHTNCLNIILSTNSVEEFILPSENNLLIISISYTYKVVDIAEFREIHKFYANWNIDQKNDNILFTPN
ncbi:hypothetical protein CONCODRAFT_10479 [Conidiobolus coronatus NRRL 28638]|uniref:F-box domain-containing protein n=1 Tax=Conidiobolus coronatus (strain ATCC 28846 / CBS 209.66 / NRRL 28638) TaxID=796925 RepID=A0A137NXN8_CONC2|nr:hypothetical protein CONCODRAFT_10479 [Conidiobolus coronatus NRRL 28638]|eukprot:KXN67431.1 hypothetical protein CONCODRAFT_10479 [Conidiobolus coronatus NRRL 28638]